MLMDTHHIPAHHETIDPCPSGKRTYTTWGQAQRAYLWQKREKRVHHDGLHRGDIRPYRCPHCPFWHLGHAGRNR